MRVWVVDALRVYRNRSKIRDKKQRVPSAEQWGKIFTRKARLQWLEGSGWTNWRRSRRRSPSRPKCQNLFLRRGTMHAKNSWPELVAGGIPLETVEIRDFCFGVGGGENQLGESHLKS